MTNREYDFDKEAEDLAKWILKGNVLNDDKAAEIYHQTCLLQNVSFNPCSDIIVFSFICFSRNFDRTLITLYFSTP